MNKKLINPQFNQGGGRSLRHNLNDIILQLHATNVTNPYTFSIQGNKSFSGICELEKTIYSITTRVLSRIGLDGGIVVCGYDNRYSETSISPNTFKGAIIKFIVSHYLASNSVLAKSTIGLSKKVADTITLKDVNTGTSYVFNADKQSVNGDNNIDSPWNYVIGKDGIKIYGNQNYKFYLY